MNEIKLLLPLAALAAVLSLSQISAANETQVQASVPTVSAKDNFFSPKTKSISTGASVKWNWRGNNDHNVKFTSAPRGASKRGVGDRAKGARPFQRSFSKAGTYRYLCTIHEDDGMRGTVKVG